MITTRTTRPVKFHGWTLEAGSSVNCYDIVHEIATDYPTITATSVASEWALCLPLDAISREAVNMLTRKEV